MIRITILLPPKKVGGACSHLGAIDPKVDGAIIGSSGAMAHAPLYLHQGESGLDRGSGSGLLPKFNRDFLVQGYICGKIFMKIRSLSGDISQIVGKALAQC